MTAIDRYKDEETKGRRHASTTLPLLCIQNIYNTYFKELKIFPCVQTSGPNQYTLYKLSLLSKINLQLCSIKI